MHMLDTYFPRCFSDYVGTFDPYQPSVDCVHVVFDVVGLSNLAKLQIVSNPF